MIDNEGRVIDYLRVSVTDRCNLRCVYCMPQEGFCSMLHEQILTYDEIIRLCGVLAEHGLKKIKITGGEPLVRKNVTHLIAQLKQLSGIESVTLTTNGVLLEQYYSALAEAGVDAITVSLDTLNADMYRQITRRDTLDAVLRGIRLAVEKNQVRLKLNCVPIYEENGQNSLELLAFAKDVDVDVRFIEMMPIGLGRKFPFVAEDVLRRQIEQTYGTLARCEQKRGNGPAVCYHVPGFVGKVGFISAVSHKFCETCNRIRLTADGFLKTCLQYDCGVHIRPYLNEQHSDQEIWEMVREAVAQKPKAHHFERQQSGQNEHEDRKINREQDEIRAMSQIGG